MEKHTSHGNASQDQSNLNSFSTASHAKDLINEEQQTELKEMKEIPETPFHCVKYQDKFFLVLGKYRLTEPMEKEEDVLKEATDASWYRVMQICNIVIKECDEIQKINERLNEIETKIQN